MSLQDCRLAAKQVDTPETVLEMAMNVSQEGRRNAARVGNGGQDAPDYVFINGDAKS